MTRYNKLIGALVGNLVAILLAWLAVQFPGIAECTPVTGQEFEACTALGFSQAQLTGGLMLVVNSAFVYLFPANRPS